MSDAKVSNFYDEIKSLLLGRTLPLVIADAGIPLPSNAVLAQHRAISSLLVDDRLPIMFAYLREQAAKQDAHFHPSKATEHELRWAKANRQVLDDMAEALVNFVAEIDGTMQQRKEYLEKEAKGDQTDTQATQI